MQTELYKYLVSERSNLTRLLEDEGIHDAVERAIVELVRAVRIKAVILTCGNGGSASDALHIAGELVGRFNHDRQAINVVCLNANVSVMTAWSNDVKYESLFARQVEAHGTGTGVLWGLSTSGNSRNVIEAVEVARNIGMPAIAMTGEGGGELARLASIVISVPARSAPSAQNLHVMLYHYICSEVERRTLG